MAASYPEKAGTDLYFWIENFGPHRAITSLSSSAESANRYCLLNGPQRELNKVQQANGFTEIDAEWLKVIGAVLLLAERW